MTIPISWVTRIIFLDIDGVLNTFHSMTRGLGPNRLHHFQKSCVKELNRIIKLGEAKIVVSSTWRKHKDWRETQAHIELEGVRGDIIGRTPSLDSRIRGEEIQAWLDAYPYQAHIGSIVILDDDSDMGLLMPWLVQPSMEGGLRRHHGDRALEILQKKRWYRRRDSNPQNPDFKSGA